MVGESHHLPDAFRQPALMCYPLRKPLNQLSWWFADTLTHAEANTHKHKHTWGFVCVSPNNHSLFWYHSWKRIRIGTILLTLFGFQGGWNNPWWWQFRLSSFCSLRVEEKAKASLLDFLLSESLLWCWLMRLLWKSRNFRTVF